MSKRANPWSDGIALQVVRMIAAHLPRAVADGGDREARSQMLLASHLAGVGMAGTGLGICHAIGHSLGGRFDIAHGVALTMVRAPALCHGSADTRRAPGGIKTRVVILYAFRFQAGRTA